jgi:hypothetical protein
MEPVAGAVGLSALNAEGRLQPQRRLKIPAKPERSPAPFRKAWCHHADMFCYPGRNFLKLRRARLDLATSCEANFRGQFQQPFQGISLQRATPINFVRHVSVAVSARPTTLRDDDFVSPNRLRAMRGDLARLRRPSAISSTWGRTFRGMSKFRPEAVETCLSSLDSELGVRASCFLDRDQQFWSQSNRVLIIKQEGSIA